VPAVPEFVLQSQIIVYHSIARERVDAMPERRCATVGSLLSSVKEQHLGHPRTSPLAVCMAFSRSRAHVSQSAGIVIGLFRSGPRDDRRKLLAGFCPSCSAGVRASAQLARSSSQGFRRIDQAVSSLVPTTFRRLRSPLGRDKPRVLRAAPGRALISRASIFDCSRGPPPQKTRGRTYDIPKTLWRRKDS
jgi:hypothetical protein